MSQAVIDLSDTRAAISCHPRPIQWLHEQHLAILDPSSARPGRCCNLGFKDAHPLSRHTPTDAWMTLVDNGRSVMVNLKVFLARPGLSLE